MEDYNVPSNLDQAQIRAAVEKAALDAVQRQQLESPWYKSTQGVTALLALIVSLVANGYQFTNKRRELAAADTMIQDARQERDAIVARTSDLKEKFNIQLAELQRATREAERQERLVRHIVSIADSSEAYRRAVDSKIEKSKMATLFPVLYVSDLARIPTGEIKDSMRLVEDLKFTDESFRKLAMKYAVEEQWTHITVDELKKCLTVGALVDFSVDKWSKGVR